MTHKSITHRRLFTCMLVIALLVATFVASTFTTSANTTVLEGVELKLGHTIGFVYYSKQEYTENTVMRFEINGRITDVEAIPNDKTCVFIFNDIYPHELAHEIKTTIFVDGKPVVSYPAFSMREYLLNELLDTSNSTNMHKLVSNLLQYGEATREYRNANVDASESDDVEILDFDRTIYTNYDPDDLNTLLSGTANNLGASANDIHLSSIGISYYNTNKYVVTLVIPDDVSVPMEKIVVSIDDVQYRMDDTSNDNIKNTQPGVYEIYSDPIHANEVYDYCPEIKLSVNGNVVQNINYSCKDYVLHLQQLEPNTRAENYAQALYYYGESANAVYTSPTVIAVGPLEKPGDITLANDQPHLPTGGLGAAYMSDGSIKEVELTWSKVDAITDDTYKVEREVVGQYKDDITGRVYSARSTVTLLNPLKEIQRWTDPSNITPDINATGYIIDDAEVKAIWSNGYSDIRNANPRTLPNNCANYFSYVYTIPLQYTDPNSGVTCVLPEKVRVYADNPITSVTTEQTSSLLFANTSGSIFVDKSSFLYTITLTSGYSWTLDASELNQYMNISTNYPTYKDDAETGSVAIKWTGTPRNTTLISGQYENGEVKPDYKLQVGQTVTWECQAVFYNPYTRIELTYAPNCNITSTAIPSSENSMLSGGVTTVYRANGHAKTLNNSEVKYVASEGITDATYSKKVNITATYNELTDTIEDVTIYNPVNPDSLVQDPNGKKHVYASSAKQKYTTAYPYHFSKGLKVTYANGVTANVTPTAFDVGEHAGEEKFYTNNIQNYNKISALHTDGGWVNTSLSTGKGIIKGLYVDDRAGVTGARTMTCELHYYVINEPQSTTTNYPQALAENYQNQYLTDRRATIEVVLMNGIKSVANVYLEQIENIQNDDEYALKQCDVYYSTPYYTMTSGSYGVYVYNPADKINFVKADPSPIQVTDTNVITSSAIEQSPGLLEVTLHNGKTKSVKPQSFTGLENVKITDKTIAKQFDIIAHYQTQEYEDATKLTTEGLTRPVKLILRNPPTEAIITLTKGTQSNPIVLTNTSQKINFTSKIKYSNKITEDVTPTSAQYLYPTGKLSSGTATDKESGNAEMTVTLLCTQSVTFERLNINGAQINDTIPSEDEKTVSKKVNVYWNNNPVSITKNSLSCAVENYNTEKVTPSAKVNVTYTNGVTKNNVTAVATPVDNIRDKTYQVTRYTDLSYTANGVTKELKTQSVILTNKATTYSIGNLTAGFTNGSGVKTINIAGTVTLTNGRTLTSTAPTRINLANNAFSPGSVTTSSTSISVTYTQGEVVNLTGNGTAYYSGYGGVTSNSFRIIIQNTVESHEIYFDSGHKTLFNNTIANSSEDSYPVLTFTQGNTTSYEPSKTLYFIFTYSNGKKSTASWDMKQNSTNTSFSWVSAPKHEVPYIYASKRNTYVQNATAQTADIKFKDSYTMSIYVIKKTSCKSRDGYTKPVSAYINASPLVGSTLLAKEKVLITYDHYSHIQYNNGKDTKDYTTGITERPNATGYLGYYGAAAQPLTSRTDNAFENRGKAFMAAATYEKWKSGNTGWPSINWGDVSNLQNDKYNYERELFVKVPITCLKFKSDYCYLKGAYTANTETEWFCFNFYRSMYAIGTEGTYNLIFHVPSETNSTNADWKNGYVKTY